jgi:hypothetical protein
MFKGGIKTMNALKETFIAFLHNIELNIMESRIKESKLKIEKLQNKLDFEKVYYKKVLTNSLKRCEEMKENINQESN